MRVHGLVVGIGLVNKDHVAVVPSWQRDQKTVASTYFEQVGGPVPVALMTMARLGMDAKPLLLSVVGGDSDGAVIPRWLTQEGVDAARIQREGAEAAHTSKSFVVLDTQDGTRTLVNAAGDGLPELDLSPERRQVLAKTRLLHLDGREPATALRAAQIVKGAGGVVSLDLGTMRPGLEDLLPLCDIIIASKKGGEGAFPALAKYPGKQVYGFLGMGASVAGVTLGKRGVVIGARQGKDVLVQIFPAFKVPDVVDTCGAGDVFHGAFLWAYLTGRDPIDCARFAQAAAAIRIRHLGNRIGLPTRAEVERFLDLERTNAAT